MSGAIYDPCHAAGGMTAYEWERDPKRIGFILARYKFVAKMLEGLERVLEVGCADGFGTRIVRQSVGRMSALDIDAKSIMEAIEANKDTKWGVDYHVHDYCRTMFPGAFDAVYALDVLEHLHHSEERAFLLNMRQQADVAIIGCPSLESQAYASELSKQGHINCKTGAALKNTLMQYWRNVFMFGMNDETLHTGFAPMVQYRLALCVTPWH